MHSVRGRIFQLCIVSSALQALQNGAIGVLVAEWKAAPMASELRSEIETTLKFLVSPELSSSDNRSLISDTSTVYTAVTDTLSSASAMGSCVGLVDALPVTEMAAVMEVRLDVIGRLITVPQLWEGALVVRFRTTSLLAHAQGFTGQQTDRFRGISNL